MAVLMLVLQEQKSVGLPWNTKLQKGYRIQVGLTSLWDDDRSRTYTYLHFIIGLSLVISLLFFSQRKTVLHSVPFSALSFSNNDI
jgi:hypothetical protein